MNVIVTVSRAKEGTYMKTFTIDAENNISAFTTPGEAAATTATPFDTFTSQKELFSLIGQWSAERLVATWNSLPGVKPVKSFKTAKVAAGRIWEGIQSLGEAVKPKDRAKAAGGGQAATGVRAKGKATKKTPPAKQAPQATKSAKPGKAADDARQGSKTAQVVAMLERKDGSVSAQ
jgi:hypothetical protein